jgi:hypothetical protein
MLHKIIKDQFINSLKKLDSLLDNLKGETMSKKIDEGNY